MPLVMRVGGGCPLSETPESGGNYKIKFIDAVAANNEVTIAYYDDEPEINVIHAVSIVITNDVIDNSGTTVAYTSNEDLNLAKSDGNTVISNKMPCLTSDSSGVQADTMGMIAFPDRFAVTAVKGNGLNFKGFVIYS